MLRRRSPHAGLQLLLPLALAAAAALAAAGGSAAQREPGFVSGIYDQLECAPAATQVLGKLVAARPQNVCRTLGIDRGPTLATCAMLELFGRLLAQMDGACLGHLQAAVPAHSASGVPLPQALPDRRPLPRGAFEQEAVLRQQEGATLHWWSMHVMNLEAWAPCASEPGHVQWLTPPGWTLLRMVLAPAEPPPAPEVPLAAVLRSSGDGSHVAVLVRGTRTGWEWSQELAYLQDADPEWGPGQMSRGMLTSVRRAWPGIEAELRAAVDTARMRHITFAGHSMGAGLATLLAYRAQVLLDELLPAAGQQRIAVGAALFAQPQVGDDVFAAAFNRRVNARRIVFEHDMVPQIPCTPVIAACPGVQSMPSYKPGVKTWRYESTGGLILLRAAAMPVQPAAWQQLATINGCRFLPWGLATHVCAYNCAFAGHVNTTNARCRLWGPAPPPHEAARLAVRGVVSSAKPVRVHKREPSTADFCFDFPMYEPVFPPLPGTGGAKLTIGG